MSKKTVQSKHPLAASLTKALRADEVTDEHISRTVAVLHEAEERALPLLVRGVGVASFHCDAGLEEEIREIADKVFGSAGIEDAITTLLDEQTPAEALFKDELRDVYNGYFTRTDDLIKSAYCLGLAMGARIGGAR